MHSPGMHEFPNEAYNRKRMHRGFKGEYILQYNLINGTDYCLHNSCIKCTVMALIARLWLYQMHFGLYISLACIVSDTTTRSRFRRKRRPSADGFHNTPTRLWPHTLSPSAPESQAVVVNVSTAP